MHRLMAVPVSVVVFLSALATVAAQDASVEQPPAQTESAEAVPSGVAQQAPAAAGSGEAVGAGDASVQAPSGTTGAAVDGAGAAVGADPAASSAGNPAAAGLSTDGTSGTSGTSTVRSASAADSLDAGGYSVRLRDLEQRINELKEQIFRSKARLALLAETVLQGVVAGAQAHITHHDEMGSSYKLVRVVYALDGAPIFNKADESGALSEREEFDIYNGSIVPGEHTLTVSLQYRGHGYGIFSYLQGYRFNINSSYTFTAAEGKMTELRVVGYEKGGPTTPLEERPQVQFMQKVSDSKSAASAAPPSGQGEEEGGE